MKLIFATFALFMLVACGGGGGGNAPDTTTPAPIDGGNDDTSGGDDTTPTCGENEKPDSFGVCLCIPGYQHRNNVCTSDADIQAALDEQERMRDEEQRRMSEEQTRVVLESLGARHANTLGFRGEGVTIHISENLRHTHVAISANIITLVRNNRFEEEDSDKSHGTGVAGILVTVAPSIRIINHRALSFVGSFGVQIANRSLVFRLPDLDYTDDLARITIHSRMASIANAYADATGEDMIWVNAAGNGGENAPELAGAIPYIRSELEDNWLIVTGVNRNTLIAFNHCGYAKMWCISAFGHGVGTAGSDSDTDYTNFFCCTSGATPQVSGALAVLKSAMPKMKMTEIRLILLETATPLGAVTTTTGERMTVNGDAVLSSVYGWGLVNISAGITHLRGIAGQMAAIEEMNIARLGGAAAAANGGKFAAAAGEGAFRFWGGLETESIYGGLATKEYGGISAFGEVGNSALEINSFLANGEVQNAESESWTAGIQRGNIWRHNDNLQISARQESRLNDGELVLQYSFGKQIRIPIKQKPATIWTAAYSQESDNGKWTAAMEWNAATNAKALSAEWRIRF